MKKVIMGVLLTLVLAGTTVLARGGPSGMAGKSPVGHLYLTEKDSSTWEPVDGGWGKMTYKEGWFVFNGHELEPGISYTLISYDEVWVNTESVELGTGVANNEGNLHLMGDLELVCNYYEPNEEGDYQDITGAKIWLVKDFDGSFVWPPTGYLFEEALITEYCEMPELN